MSALVGWNYANIVQKSYNWVAPFGQTGDYDESKVTPNYSFIVKPLSGLTTYLTYSEALEQGQIVPGSGTVTYTNAGEILPPFVSTEYEIGVKADVNGLLLTAAAFKIDKALQYAVFDSSTNAYTYVQDGRQVHKGIELTATGNVSDGLRIYGGLTFLDAEVTKQEADPRLVGKRPVNVADKMAKLTAEYDLPFVPGLTVTGGVYYVGNQAADALNTAFVPSYVTEDIGLRYRTRLPTGQEAVMRLNVSNLTDESYWINNISTGLPRSVAFSTQVKF